MKLFISLKTKRVALISIMLVLFFIVIFLIILPASIGFGKGFDSAMVEGKLRKECHCGTIESIKTTINNETFINDLKEQKLLRVFSLKLADCKYSTLEDLKLDVLAILVKNDICDGLEIEVRIDDFGSRKQRFSIKDCNLNNI